MSVEVKGGLNGPAKGLSAGQVGVNQFSFSRIERAAGGQGQWASRNVAAGTQEFAKFVEREMARKTYEGVLFQHDNMRSGQAKVRASNWK